MIIKIVLAVIMALFTNTIVVVEKVQAPNVLGYSKDGHLLEAQALQK